jgi:hypothetical protein
MLRCVYGVLLCGGINGRGVVVIVLQGLNSSSVIARNIPNKTHMHPKRIHKKWSQNGS